LIDAAPQMPPLPDKPVAEAIVDCGVRTGTFTVNYDDELQGNMIIFLKSSEVNRSNIQCIWEATWSEFVQFPDPELQEAYDAIGQKYYDTHFKGQVLESARANLAKHGLLENLPKSGGFDSREEFAVALERHCGFAPHSTLRVEGDSFTIWPQGETAPPSGAEFERLSCLLASLTLAAEADGNLKIGFVGNELVAD
jgi:hypothetical protein